LEAIAVFVAANSVTVTGINFRNFFTGIFVQRGKGNFTLKDCVFDGVLTAVFVAREGHAAKILNNVFNLPVPPSPDVTSDFGITNAVFVARQNQYLLVAGNTITGPGRVANYQRNEDILDIAANPALSLHSAGIFQIDNLPPASMWGRISNNIVSDVDLGIQSSSNFGVVSNNTVTGSAIGLGVSNDTDNGVTQVTDNVVTGNEVRGNQIGIWMASASRNVISLNDGRDNSLTGLLFLNNVDGPPSDANVFVLNQGSKQGVSGNQGVFIKASRE
jgi:parallel beta-helix repeat protein